MGRKCARILTRTDASGAMFAAKPTLPVQTQPGRARPSRLGTLQTGFFANTPAGNTIFRRNPSPRGPFPTEIPHDPCSGLRPRIGGRTKQAPRRNPTITTPALEPEVSVTPAPRRLFLDTCPALALGYDRAAPRRPPSTPKSDGSELPRCRQDAAKMPPRGPKPPEASRRSQHALRGRPETSEAPAEASLVGGNQEVDRGGGAARSPNWALQTSSRFAPLAPWREPGPLSCVAGTPRARARLARRRGLCGTLCVAYRSFRQRRSASPVGRP